MIIITLNIYLGIQTLQSTYGHHQISFAHRLFIKIKKALSITDLVQPIGPTRAHFKKHDLLQVRTSTSIIVLHNIIYNS